VMSNLAADVWLRHERWSAAAGLVKTGLGRWRTVVFGLGISGAFLATLATQFPPGTGQKICAAVGALCLAIIPVLTQRKLKPESARAWARARSASEGLKSEVYRYRAQVAPYDDPATADHLLRDNASAIEEAVDDLVRHQARAEPEGSPPPGPLGPEEYVAERVRDQIDYYRPSSRTYERRAGRLRTVEFILALTAAVLAASAGVFDAKLSVLGGTFVFGAWVAVLTTIGGSITAQIGVTRYDFLVTSYLGTARRLEDLATRWPPVGGGEVPSPEWTKFVQECEDAISTENRGWMAKWTKS